MAEKHYYEQQRFCEDYIIPFLEKHLSKFRSLKILEVGSGEGGVVSVLKKAGYNIEGFEISASRVKTAKEKDPQLPLFVGDLTDAKILDGREESYDLIILRDVIEHISNKKSAFEHIYRMLKPNGYFYITFPPRFSPFAGHQQNGKTVLRLFPFLHLLPDFLIDFFCKIFDEDIRVIKAVKLNFKIGLTLNDFEKLIEDNKFNIVKMELFFSRPIFKLRYKIPTIKFPNIVFLREFFATGCETLLKK